MLHDLCAVSQETWNLVIEYIFYGSVFVVGLVILLLMKRRSVRPAAVLAKEGAEKAIARIDRLLASLGREKNNYAFPAKMLRLSGEIGDLILLADRELTQKGNIAFDGVLSACKAAAEKVSAIDVIWGGEQVETQLLAVKADLQRALDIIEKIRSGKEQTA